MANEIHFYYPSGSTVYACVRNAAGLVWYVAGSVFEAWGTAGRTAADYAITMTGDAGDLYVGSMDTDIGAGRYDVQVFLRAGGAPADADDVLGADEIQWSGTAEVLPAVVGSQMTLTAAYDAAKTAAQPGADGDTLETLSDQMDVIDTLARVGLPTISQTVEQQIINGAPV